MIYEEKKPKVEAGTGGRVIEYIIVPVVSLKMRYDDRNLP
jgi:hypothetical protein